MKQHSSSTYARLAIRGAKTMPQHTDPFETAHANLTRRLALAERCKQATREGCELIEEYTSDLQRMVLLYSGRGQHIVGAERKRAARCLHASGSELSAKIRQAVRFERLTHSFALELGDLLNQIVHQATVTIRQARQIRTSPSKTKAS